MARFWEKVGQYSKSEKNLADDRADGTLYIAPLYLYASVHMAAQSKLTGFEDRIKVRLRKIAASLREEAGPSHRLHETICQHHVCTDT